MISLRFSRDDRGSLPMAVMVVTVGIVMSAMLLPVILQQIKTTRGIVDRNTALNGAQVGLDVVMARVRAASVDENGDGIPEGQLEDMPQCTVTGDAGVDGTGEKLKYKVTIKYFDQEGNKIDCPLSKVPATATVTSEGLSPQYADSTDPTRQSAGSRTLSATYVFSTSNNNIPGGAIKIASSSVGSLCFDAGSNKPAAGAALTAKLCNGSATQQFGYTPDLYLKLINSENTANGGYGMCLAPAETKRANGLAVAFKNCPTASNSTEFQWSLDGSSRFHSTSPSQGIESYCINMKAASTVGSAIILNGCGSDSTLVIWRSDAGVGAGMAGARTNQLVNYRQFSRCLDVTNQDTNQSYMIAWFCKQSPKGAVDWNQIWKQPIPVAPATSKTGPLAVTRDITKAEADRAYFCLKSPQSDGAKVYVTTVSCNPNSTTLAKELLWTVYYATDSYATSYRIVDTTGKLCLQPTDLNATPKDTHSDGTSKVKVEKCNSSELQKWNAPANINKLTPITDVNEK
ncbi:hypothetical protein Ait01nite_000180 [Actinoplanes italicus]|uniref:Ricin-type beta-trefoil lectin protein n=1 Tax=Actinoplanes italicus TaxID=113567 RepID=A0A2T0KDA9_9ACTN|nr:ricin-type beta-trefoil lectin domain protein [Actinoplanes italicus]PRX21295.1 ricin-type beta-trefoil lectin protein [Actinoplanes italicus]GIE26973.1 hypothetical protein Ait01nite_000180 [Actinoplanes italicus]